MNKRTEKILKLMLEITDTERVGYKGLKRINFYNRSKEDAVKELKNILGQ